MARTPTLTFDRGTLILHPPPRGKAWMDFATWDDRVEKFRIRAIQYRPLVEALQAQNTDFIDEAKAFVPLELTSTLEMEPYLHQTEALAAWKLAGRQGVVVLPTAAGKTYLAQMAMQATPRSTLIVVPTLDLMHQWYAHLKAAFPDVEVGLLGGGSRDKTPILVATYDSAAIHAETIGNQYGLLIFDECHHLPTDFNRVIAEYAIAPYRLGLSATPERTDGKHADLNILIGKEVYRKRAEDLAGKALAEHEVVQIKVKLAQQERERYSQLIQVRNDFLRESRISLGSLQGWQHFVQMSARSQAGRRAMLAHREAKEIALGTDGKLRILADLIAQHYPERILIFTADNATVYRISSDFLIPAITHQTPVKERHEILTKFREGEYKSLVASHVLNEGVDVPAASIAIILSGTGSAREYIQRLGRVLRKGNNKNKQAILYEVIAEDTSEEGTSARRRGNEPQRIGGSSPEEQSVRRKKREEKKKNLQIVYGTGKGRSAKAAEQMEINYSVENSKSSTQKSKDD
ncbi:DEAD/DEAH box helicase family protein [Aetokthonos hydrillicola Thurmond2011]|jgi:superfamily II DNA or RNA helicase|uniref:DNA 3'-5' helicase n=1 Tax=Aetokthonos hydrillicola Thurmond2011 TaxID=2712845 RepID=A0AAP5IB01_9CYAN|nr:DEAD/DEAH box helicase family protein [Aetokthonos hydrillicola]MBO3462380.1 DEAD/DEAH box helicase [Aetokthonos hydrillicola CCALA 1050]MBW4590394.1 DEAD/DEAH box helicase family protein [Aetokthonos hydrillicola CCALA 1050]MDR9898196.1 DEAD/DEAH box helicase family protein [Aetokthonos hydrillicola Thurmond2011]